MTTNLSAWRHFFELRTAKAAHPQMRQLAIPLLHEFQKLIPIVFDDIEPLKVVKAEDMEELDCGDDDRAALCHKCQHYMKDAREAEAVAIDDMWYCKNCADEILKENFYKE